MFQKFVFFCKRYFIFIHVCQPHKNFTFITLCTPRKQTNFRFKITFITVKWNTIWISYRNLILSKMFFFLSFVLSLSTQFNFHSFWFHFPTSKLDWAFFVVVVGVFSFKFNSLFVCLFVCLYGLETKNGFYQSINRQARKHESKKKDSSKTCMFWMGGNFCLDVWICKRHSFYRWNPFFLNAFCILYFHQHN